MAVYEEWPIETDPNELALDAHAWLKDRWGDYVPSPANFDSGTIDAHARMIAELRDLAANVPDDIFRRLGPIAGVPTVDAAPATVTATVTATDALGYVLEAGTTFGLRATGDVLYLFASDEDVTIPPGDTVSAEFALTATEAGAGPNGLGGVSVPMVLADRTLTWLASAQTASVATGGADVETTTDFMNRLVRAFRVMAPRPILPDDFASFAVDDTAVARAYAVDLYAPGTNERQTVTHDSSGGTFTLTYSGQTTAAIAWNATAGAVQSALEALSNIAPGDVVVTGGPLPTLVTVEFAGTLGESNVAAMTANGTNLTGGADVVTITTVTAGAAPNAATQRAVTVWVVTAEGLDPGATARARIEADLRARREAGFLAYVRAPGYDDVSVTYTGVCYPGWDPAEVQTRVDAAIAEFLSPAEWGIPRPAFGDPIEGAPWYQDSVVRLPELVTLIENVDGFWRLTGPGANGMPQINGSSANYTLAAYSWQPVVLPTPGVISGTVTLP